MLPRLQAEEQIAAANLARFTDGKLSDADARRFVNRLERTAAGDAEKRQKPTPAVLMLQAQALGIDVVMEPKP